MWTWEDQYLNFQSMAQDQDATNLTLGKKNINLGTKKLEVSLGMPPMEEQRTYTTVTSTNTYQLPNRFIRMMELYVTISGQRYYADAIYNDQDWGFYQRQTSVTGDQLTKVFVRPGLHTFEVYPKFATAGLTMTMIYESFTKDLSADNYITGSITTLAQGGTTVTFTGETLTSSMAGRWLKTDDGEWYKIQSVTPASHTATLLMPYQGDAISSGTSTFIIGEMTRLPEGTHDLPVEFALWKHFSGVNRDDTKAKVHKQNWEEGVLWAKAEFGSRYTSGVIPSQRNRAGRARKDPNDYPDLSNA